MKYHFKVVVHGWDGKDHDLFITKSTIEEVLEEAVHMWGRNSSYDIHVGRNHPFVVAKQKNDWAI